MVRVYYSPDYVSSGCAFDTTRKSMWVAASLADWPMRGIELAVPAPLTGQQVAEVHAPSYVCAIESGSPRTLAESQGFGWNPELWPIVLSSNGGAVAAALTALRDGTAGSLSSGFHHARRERGAGRCTFNGLVLAARAALAGGARSVLILDLDAHCGGGTASLIADEPRIAQIDVSVNSFDRYASSERIRLEIVDKASNYLPTIQRLLREADAGSRQFDLCLYNAGMDPHEHCSTGGMGGITREVLGARERLVFDWCRERGLPIAFVLGGGHVASRLDRHALVDLHRLTLSCASAAHRRALLGREPGGRAWREGGL